MTRKQLYNFYTLTALFLVSCEPIRSIIVKPDKTGQRTLTIYAKEDFLPSTTMTHYYKKELQLPLMTSDKETFVFYGVGVWTDSLLKDVSKTIDSTVIRRPSSTTKYTTPVEIQKYLRKNLRGLKKQQIRLKVK